MARRRKGRSIWADKPEFPKYLLILTAGLFVSVLFSFLASFFWFFDLFSHFVPHYIIASAIIAPFLLKHRKYFSALIAFTICFFYISQMLPLFIKKDAKEDERSDVVNVLQFNVNRNNNNVEDIAKWIISLSEDVEIIVLFETNEKWDDALRRIKWSYPYYIRKDMRGGRDIAVFSRVHIDEFEIKYAGNDEAPIVVLRGKTSGYNMPFVLYGIHPPPPVMPSYAKRRNEILITAANNIAEEKISHKLIIGDFNATRFSPWLKKTIRISGLNDSNEGLGIGSYFTTWPSVASHYLGVGIDNMLISDNIKVAKKEVKSSMGSDHFPVMTTLQFLKE